MSSRCRRCTEAGMPAEQAARLKADEKALAQRLQREGTWRHLWRIAGLYANVSIFDVPDAQALHDTLMQLPMVGDVNGQPLAGAIVDVWHANTGGYSSHAGFPATRAAAVGALRQHVGGGDLG